MVILMGFQWKNLLGAYCLIDQDVKEKQTVLYLLETIGVLMLETILTVREESQYLALGRHVF